MFTAGFGPASRHLETAEGMPFHDRAGAAAIQIEVAHEYLLLCSLERFRAARKNAGGEGVVRGVHQVESLIENFKAKIGLLQNTVALINEMRKGNEAGAARIVSGLKQQKGD